MTIPQSTMCVALGCEFFQSRSLTEHTVSCRCELAYILIQFHLHFEQLPADTCLHSLWLCLKHVLWLCFAPFTVCPSCRSCLFISHLTTGHILRCLVILHLTLLFLYEEQPTAWSGYSLHHASSSKHVHCRYCYEATGTHSGSSVPVPRTGA